jgi:hypothetical protein
MPTPEGNITSTQTWVEPQQDVKKYRVELIVKRRVVVVVESDNEDDAVMKAQDIYHDGVSGTYDEFILGPDATIEQIQ